VGDGMIVKLVQNDIGSQFQATLTREHDGSAVDLTDATVTCSFRAKGSSTNLSTLSCVSTASQLEDGKAIFRFSSGNLDVDIGKYEGQIQVEFDSGDVESVQEIVSFFVGEDKNL
jgi:hypothetical protein